MNFKNLVVLAAAVVAPLLVQAEVRELEWLELMPEEEFNSWLEESEQVDHSGFGSPEPFQSFRTMPELDGLEARIPGFVVPIETDGEGNLKEFFLVPYFGACIHVPPPPANQIVYVTTGEEPASIRGTFDTVWVTGTLHTERTRQEKGTAGYTIRAEEVAPYD